MVVNWREKKECGHDAKEGADKDSVYSSVPLKSVGLNLLCRRRVTEPEIQWFHIFMKH